MELIEHFYSLKEINLFLQVSSNSSKFVEELL